MARGSVIVSVAWLCGAGCTFGTDGMGGGPDLGSASADGSTGGSESGSEVDPSDTGEDPAESSDSADDASTSDITTTGEPGTAARLVFVPNALDFGNVAVDGDAIRMVDVRNAGGSTAMINTDVVVPGAFGLSNGYPGEGGNCGSELGPGDSCSLAVGFHPNAIGPHVSNVRLSYYDGVDLGAPIETPPLPLEGGGVGETANLIVNPSAEAGLDGWTMNGSTWTATTVDAVQGGHSFQAGNPALGTTTLTQTIGLGEWLDPLAVGGLHFNFAGAARSPAGGASYRIDLEFDTGSQSPLQGTSSSWDSVDTSGPAPLGATTVTVTLTCMSIAFTECSALFDGLALSLVYPAPS
jgi:hypothetical protein